MPNGPAIGIGHVVLTVADVEASSRFYTHLGLKPFQTSGGSLAILELRGGTHLILLPREDDRGRARPPERIDLMISGRTREALEIYRAEVIAKGLDASGIRDKSMFGHYSFSLSDPDGNEVKVATSHSSLRSKSAGAIHRRTHGLHERSASR